MKHRSGVYFSILKPKSMKQTLLFSILFMFGSWAVAQSFSVSSQSATMQGSIGQDLSPSVVLRNLTSRPIELQWELDKQNLPNDWTAQICEKNCRNIESKNHTFVLAPYEIVSNFRVNFATNGQEGAGYIDIRLFETQKRSASETMLSFFGAAQSSSAAAKPMNQRIFPNPATEYIMLQDEDNSVKIIEVYNVIGRKILQFRAGTAAEKYDISELPLGMYMVRMLDNKGNIIRTQRISKYNP
jgi:hypothetical protein